MVDSIYLHGVGWVTMVVLLSAASVRNIGGAWSVKLVLFEMVIHYLFLSFLRSFTSQLCLAT